MIGNQAAYRLRQFFFGLTAHPSKIDLDAARRVLTPTQMILFLKMQPAEQAHSLLVMRKLAAAGETDPHLLTAALLHDVGKMRAPLNLWERSIIVIAKKVFPKRVKTWGRGAPAGWQRPFVVGEQHPAWGAELAQQAGVSLRAVEIIRSHQLPPDPQSPLYLFLCKLQAADDES